MARLPKIKISTPPEQIVSSEVFVMIFNAEKMIRDGKRLVNLACGHVAYGRALEKMVCPRCREMLRRSIEDGREDYEGFRHGNLPDVMVWPEDPCRQFNEPTDLGGNYKRA
ncbi:hypothetical protein ACVIGB_000470 [Bradyrhizobium sp. USDA 4341]